MKGQSKKWIVVAGIFSLFSMHGKAQDNPQAQKLDALLNMVSYAYVDSIDQKKITEDAIRALLKELDPQSLNDLIAFLRQVP